ncbi:MAG TPA: aminotransferase class V-fold PLP-dependent enzyme [Armatimonadota bacterium]|nr:aminotransferase class V-fold PLP-dependent enzyme [Armatimonadota bacterium]
MIYLDNAATTFPKPEGVYSAMDRFLRTSCANPGRSGHRMAVESQRVVSQCRQAVAGLLGAPSVDRVVFALNATDAINTAIKGLVRPGDHVVSTLMKHNAVARPLKRLEAEGVEVTYVPASAKGEVRAADVIGALRPETRLVAMIHASNVAGTLQPVEEVAAVTRCRDALLLVDAAQTAGAVPVHIADMGIDLLAFAGHKGTLGPPGTGGLVLGMRADPRPLREGGTGTRSESVEHPDELPERLEAGTMNVSGLVGLLEGVRHVMERSVEGIREHELAAAQAIEQGLARVPGVTLHGPRRFVRRAGVVSFSLENMDPRDVAAVLDTSFGIATRPGLHCAPLAHQSLGTYPVGTVRMSPGPFTTEADVRAAVDAVAAIAGAV